MDQSPVVVIDGALRDRMIGLARAALPNEACGLLHGANRADWGATEIRVGGICPVENAARSPTCFVLDPQRMLDAEDAIDEMGHVVLGVMHSHPSSQPVPSQRDRTDAAAYDPKGTMLSVLLSMQGFSPLIRAWRIDGVTAADVTELTVRTIETQPPIR